MIEFRRADFMDDAACRGMNPDMFHPPKGGVAHLFRQAKAVCAVCPVRQECADYTIADSSLRGIWGGLSEHERRDLRWPKGRRRLEVAS